MLSSVDITMTTNNTSDVYTEWHSLDKNVEKRIISHGQGCESPFDGFMCTFHISHQSGDIGCGLKGVVLNSDVCICLGEADQMLSLLIELCLKSMKKEEMCELKLNGDLLTNDNIHLPSGHKSTDNELVFAVHLKSFSGQELFKQTCKEKLKFAHRYKEIGTKMFKQGQVNFAFKFYGKAIKILICINRNCEEFKIDDLEKEWKLLKFQCHLNLAACNINAGSYRLGVDNCTRALMINVSNVKALYRRAFCYYKQSDWIQSEEDLINAQHIEPADKDLLKLWNMVKKSRTQHEAMLGNRIRKMFVS